jgi:hypothetical protein
MDTLDSSSYVSLKLAEIQKRFEELGDEDLVGLSLEEPEDTAAADANGYNPYSRS